MAYKNNYETIDIETDPRFQMEYIVTLLNLQRVYNSIPKNGNILYRSPLCEESKNSNHGHLYIDFIKNKYYDVKSGEGGKPLSLYAKIRGIDNKAAFKELIESDLTKKQNKQIYNIKIIKKEIEKNKAQENITLAGIKRRDQVYRALLAEISLSQMHRESLLKRGLSNEFINSMNYKTIPKNANERTKIAYNLIKKGYKLTGIPGFHKDKNSNWTFKDYGYNGFLVPVLDVQNRIQAFQVRRFVEKGKYIWFSSAGEKEGTAVEAFINITTSFDKTKPFVIVEGILKSQVCGYLRPSANYIGIAGTNAIRFLIDTLKELGIKNVYVAFDMDKLTNKYVAKAENKLKNQLQENTIEYEIVNWNINMGKGIDDYMLTLMLKQQNVVGGFVYCG